MWAVLGFCWAYVYARVHLGQMVGPDHPMHRRARELWTVAELAAFLGCSEATVKRLRRSFLTRRQKDYLNAVRYNAGFYPRRKGRDGAGV